MDTTPSLHPADDFDQTIKVRTPQAGAMYFNRYKLTRILGRGGMGVVWLADDLKLERPVALKFLPSLIGLDPSAVKELKTETRRGLELSHPNIVRIYDFVDDEDVAAISMEFVNARTLSELKTETETGVFTADQVAKWLPGVCEALDYAHFQCKVVHRDLKPSNIMANLGDDKAKIADFGIARSISDTMSRLSVSQLGVSGTLPYMSPQQAMGEKPAPTDDVYSLGATIYELLSGKPPFFRGDIPSQITSKIPPSMFERREELEIKAEDSIPKEWEAVIAACLQKDPTLRPPSAGKLLELLGLKGGTSAYTKTFVMPGAAAPPAAKSEARSRMPIYAAAAVAVVAAGSAFYFKSTTPAPVAAVPPSGAAPVVAVPAEVVTAPAPSPATPEPAAAAPVLMPAATGGEAPPATVTAAAPESVPTPAAPVPAPVMVAAAPPEALPTPAIPTTGAMPLTLEGAALTQPPPASADAPLVGGLPPAAMIQPPVSEPPNGHWPIAMLFPTPPHASYSENGRRRLLYEVQGLLKKQSLYTSTQDGKEGKGTHNAIILFQAKNGLVPNGLLDGPTLTAMSLATETDVADWRSPAAAGAYSGRRAVIKEEPNMLQRAGQSIGRLFKRD